LSNTGKIFNAVVRNAPASLAWYKKHELSQFNNLKLNLSYKVPKDSNAGSLHITLKTKDALNFIGVAFSFNDEKDKKE